MCKRQPKGILMPTRRTFVKLAGVSALAACSGALLQSCSASAKKGIYLPSKTIIRGQNYTIYTDLFSYDDKGNLTCYTHTIEYPSTNAQGNGSTEQTDYTYDEKGTLTTIARSQFHTNNRKTLMSEESVSIEQGKNGLPSIVTMTQTGGSLWSNGEQETVDKYTLSYSSSGALVHATRNLESHGNYDLSGDFVYEFDESGWPLEESTWSGKNTTTYRASKDKEGNVTTLIVTRKETIESYNKNSGSDSYEYEYDADGNATAVSKDGKKVAEIEYTYIERPSDLAYALGLIAKYTGYNGGISIFKLW